MFKKSLIALAVSGAVATSVSAIEFDPDPATFAVNVSIEGSRSIDPTDLVPGLATVNAILDRQYQVSDRIRFTISGGEWVAGQNTIVADLQLLVRDGATSYAQALIDDPAQDTTGAVWCDGTDSAFSPDTLNTSLVTESTTELLYRISEFESQTCNSSVGAQLPVPAFTVTAGAATTEICVDTFIDGGPAIESSTCFSNAVTFVQQFAFNIVDHKLDGEIDVDPVSGEADRRRVFTTPNDGATPGSDTATTDSFVLQAVTETAGLTYPATLADADFTLKIPGRDWTFLGIDGVDAAVDLATVIAGGFFSVDPTAVTPNGITWDGVNPTTQAVTIDVSGLATGEVLTAGDFTVDVDVNYSDYGDDPLGGGTVASWTDVLVTDADAGEWTINGSVIQVPYMPMGPNTQPIIRMTNTGSQTGAISLRYIVEGTDGWVDAGVLSVGSNSESVTNLLQPTIDAIMASSTLDPSVAGFKVALEYTTNAPTDDITVYAAAKVTADMQDRLTVGAFGDDGHNNTPD